jgi:hypothetical protein
MGLFGDALPPGHPPNSILSVPPDDALGSTMRTTPPDSTACLDLQLITSAPKTFAHPTVQPTIQQGTFNVPSGGVFLDNTFYAFFWTDHCAFPSGLSHYRLTALFCQSSSASRFAAGRKSTELLVDCRADKISRSRADKISRSAASQCCSASPLR